MTTLFPRRWFLQLAAAGLAVRFARGDSGVILLAYATKCGCTREIAEVIARDLRARGLMIDVRAAKDVKALTGYRAVVLGSAVRFGKWLPEGSDFVERHQAALAKVPKAFFTVHMMNTGDDEKSRKGRAGYVQPIYARVKPDFDAFFAGRMDTGKLSFSEKLLIKMMKGSDRDLRNWTAIHGWSKSLFQPV